MNRIFYAVVVCGFASVGIGTVGRMIKICSWERKNMLKSLPINDNTVELRLSERLLSETLIIRTRL